MARDSTKGKSRADRVRTVHQDELRKRLSSQNHIGHLVRIAKDLRDFAIDLDTLQVQRLRAAAEQHRHLVDKYLPSLKAIEHTGDMHTNLSDLLHQLADTPQTQPSMPVDASLQPDTAPKTLN